MSMSAIEVYEASSPRTFITPVKRIHEGQDVFNFLTTMAYRDIMTFVMQLNASMFPCATHSESKQNVSQIWEIGSSDIVFSGTVLQLKNLLRELDQVIDEVPPDPGPRRFGNASFRKWCQTVESRVPSLLENHIPKSIQSFQQESNVTALDELKAYLLGSFGSSQRLDYGTGHELSFLAFLGCIWKLGGFETSQSCLEERGIVLGLLDPYLSLVRRLIKTYTLEPAGSHGVWGLDDHSFLPYIFGSAQYGPPITSNQQIPTEGSRANSPDPGDVVKANVVEKERNKNFYFGAVGFIYDVKKGPFWEHSPTLYDISGVRAGWAKINKGMIKMYNAEVLSKFPVVQHFPFGSMFSWDRDPDAIAPSPSTHMSNQPGRTQRTTESAGAASSRGPSFRSNEILPSGTPLNLPNPMVGTAAPWAIGKQSGMSSAIAKAQSPTLPKPGFR